MSNPQRIVVVDPTIKDETTDQTGTGYGWKCILFNCNCHSFQDVEIALAKAGVPDGKKIAVVVHNKGSAVVFSGEPQQCEAIAMILEDAGLNVKVSQ